MRPAAVPAALREGLEASLVVGIMLATSWLLALVPVMFSYSGWNAAVYVAEEVKQPVKNVPRALLLGTRLGSEFIPQLDEGNIAMHALRIPGTSL